MTAADAVDKYASQIVDAIKAATPLVWRAAWLNAIGRYVVQGVAFAMVAIFGWALFFQCVKALRGRTIEQREDAWSHPTVVSVGYVFFLLLAVAFTIAAVGQIPAALFSAKFAAIESVVGLVKP